MHAVGPQVATMLYHKDISKFIRNIRQPLIENMKKVLQGHPLSGPLGEPEGRAAPIPFRPRALPQPPAPAAPMAPVQEIVVPMTPSPLPVEDEFPSPPSKRRPTDRLADGTTRATRVDVIPAAEEASLAPRPLPPQRGAFGQGSPLRGEGEESQVKRARLAQPMAQPKQWNIAFRLGSAADGTERTVYLMFDELAGTSMPG